MKLCLSCKAVFDKEEWSCPVCGYMPSDINGFLSFMPNHNENINYNSANYQYLFDLESNHFWFKSRSRLITSTFCRYFANAESFLEIGSGTGMILSAVEKYFPNCSILGSDVHIEGLAFARHRLQKTELYQIDARRLPFINEFEVIGAFDVIEHIQEDELVLRQIYTALKPGGGLIITVPQHRFLWSRKDERAGHVRRYTSHDLCNKVRTAGFRIVRSASFVSLLFPFILLSRLLVNYASSKNSDPTHELTINPGISVVLERVLDAERKLFNFGITFPFGGSLLIVARKEQ